MTSRFASPNKKMRASRRERDRSPSPSDRYQDQLLDLPTSASSPATDKPSPSSSSSAAQLQLQLQLQSQSQAQAQSQPTGMQLSMSMMALSPSSSPSSSARRHPSSLPALDVEYATPTSATALAFSKMDFQSPMPPRARLASAPTLLMPVGRTASALPLPMTCTFEALSHHFHLPLKVAAEKFGVRATAFKKRCRAIGIRHWPYRKVRSLRRSLEELGRCREEGMLNEKQQHQLLIFQSQLDKLLSPETYGIDPSGRLPPGAWGQDQDDGDDDQDDGDDDDNENDSCSSGRSPRPRSRGHAQVAPVGDLSHFKIATLRTKRKKQPVKREREERDDDDLSLPSGMVAMGPAHAHHYGAYGLLEGAAPHPNDGSFPSVSVRFAASNLGLGMHSNLPLPGFESYDPFFQDFKSEFTLSMEDFGDEPISGSLGIEGTDEFLPFARSPTMAALRMNETRGVEAPASTTGNASSAAASSLASDSHHPSPASASTSTSANDAMEDDVFLHISPDYGCLV